MTERRTCNFIGCGGDLLLTGICGEGTQAIHYIHESVKTAQR